MRTRLILFITLCGIIFSSCNTPDRVIDRNSSSSENSDGNTSESGTRSDGPVSFDGDVTVTPIILPIERREVTPVIGDYQEENENFDLDESYIINNEYDDEVFEVGGDENPIGGQSNRGMAVTPTVVSSGELKDAISIMGYNPFGGVTVLPGEAFHVDITLYNIGTTVWQTTYSVVNYSEINYGVKNTIPIPEPVGQNDTTIISVYIQAPSEMGHYTQNFYIQDAFGVPFGYFDYSFVVGDYSVVTAIPSQLPDWPTATPQGLADLCISSEGSKQTDCSSFCPQYHDSFPECYIDGELYIPADIFN